MDWKKKAETITQATGLPIRGVECSNAEWEQLRLEQERNGWELIYLVQNEDRAFLYLIQPEYWDPAARALLKLYLTPAATPQIVQSLTEQLASWFRSLPDHPETPPPRSVQELTWREKRVVFLLERCRNESNWTWETVEPLLRDYIPGIQPTPLIIPLNPIQLLLVVPLSVIGSDSREDNLEWAYGLQELLACEALDSFRVLVSPPLSTLTDAGRSFIELYQLSLAMQRYRPSEMVAASWQYPLERWAAMLPDAVAAELLQAMSSVRAHPALTPEQKETLETLFARQLNVSETARQLYIHRNTLLYRLDKITEATGLDPRHFPDAVLLQLHLLFGRN
ncbi:PucR family transcriptional regulator [Brevibacillus panacihumi]|uniref:PucR family transcriptional regulator n=1 Tax=Brevibacillus panacihumi TaxID=497735 RepID=A0A3M8DEG8_9BACL|nr:helix-turn-helix domain-containing protein [Brevibacillus panacihumi]RNB86398.1 PucR family transcriptional regulator [Brevibacillus panacihumi]